MSRPAPAQHDHASAEGLLSVSQARERVLEKIQPLSPIVLPLQESYGCTLAEDMFAAGDLPSFSSSAMDGFAVRSNDVGQASEGGTDLRIVGRALIGHRPEGTVGRGEAMGIATGAPIPAGADAVVPIENVVVDEDRVRVMEAVQVGRHIRPVGEDVKEGDVLVRAGRRLGAPEMGLLASAGHSRVLTHPRPRVIVLSTGDELVEPGRPTRYGQIPDSNAFTLFGALREAGAVPYLAGIVRDDVDQLKDTIFNHLVQADAFISSGGVSMGDRDVVKAAFFRRGDLDFFRVAMQPGMPQAFGLIEGKPYWGLPGNPVSVFASFEVFIRPALMKMMARRDLFRPEITAKLTADITGPRGKTQFARVLVRRTPGGRVAEPTGGSASNLISTIARANGLAIVPPGVETLRAGSDCRVMLFRAPE
ncbi:MAG: molybdopterin molybdotransferase MoeA [Actinomycetota bacterium]|nr:molybdopterin molybdotransferase MoeA [Actinomycetota bacterium]